MKAWQMMWLLLSAAWLAFAMLGVLNVRWSPDETGIYLISIAVFMVGPPAVLYGLLALMFNRGHESHG